MSETLSGSAQHPSHPNLPGEAPHHTEWWTLRLQEGQAKPEWNSYLLRLVEKGLWLFYYITEKSILVMIDLRPTVVPREP
jgi:hypothetical protein